MDIVKIKLKRMTVRDLLTKLTTNIENTVQNSVNKNYLIENKIEVCMI